MDDDECVGSEEGSGLALWEYNCDSHYLSGRKMNFLQIIFVRLLSGL